MEHETSFSAHPDEQPDDMFGPTAEPGESAEPTGFTEFTGITGTAEPDGDADITDLLNLLDSAKPTDPAESAKAADAADTAEPFQHLMSGVLGSSASANTSTASASGTGTASAIPPVAASTIPPDDCNAIRDVLLHTAGIRGDGDGIEMPVAAGALRNAGYPYDRYGFEKARPYFNELERLNIIAMPDGDINPRSNQHRVTVRQPLPEDPPYGRRAARILADTPGRTGPAGRRDLHAQRHEGAARRRRDLLRARLRPRQGAVG